MKAIQRFRNIHAGQTGVVIGNGPSLRQKDLLDLSRRYTTFGSNQIYRLPFTPNYYSIIDEEMCTNCLPLPETFRPEESFIRAEFGVGNPVYPIVASGFSLDPSNFVVMGGTVTFVLLQMAFYMGFATILLIGVDHSYPKAAKLTPGSPFVANNNDPDHFVCADGEPYFQEGRTYNAPELEGTTKAYEIARELFEKAGRKIVNITRQSELKVFDQDQLENWI